MSTVAELIESGLLRSDVPLGSMTTYKAGGSARWFFGSEGRNDLDQLIESGLPTEFETLILGRGSNLVVADEGFDGLVVHLGQGHGVVEVEGNEVIAGSSTPLPRLARHVTEQGLRGLEFFVGVPGSVGGAVRQNAGCFGKETRDVLVLAELIDLRTGHQRPADAADLDMSYRNSNVSQTEVVIKARFLAEPGDIQAGKDEMLRITRWRKENQPGGTFNAGSVFKNPEEIAAGQLIDELGLKGTAVGDVRVSEKHANFFVAGPAATASDIRALVDVVKDRVLAETGTMLETEIQFVGFDE